MSNLRITIDAGVRAQFPELACGAFVVKGLPGANAGQFLLDSETVRARLAARGVTEDTILAQPPIEAWRRAIKACGLKASKFRGSAEQLVRRAVRGDTVATPDAVVRLYCQVSALHMAPLGGYDLHRLPSHNIEIRHARPTDTFQPLGGGDGDMELSERVVVYAAGDDVICWAFNVRDDRRTALRETTVDALFTTEAVFAEQRPFAEDALTTLQRYLRDGGASVTPIVWTDGGSVAEHLTWSAEAAPPHSHSS